MLDDPKRCFKCQHMGHMATSCKEIHDICPNCAGAHSGNECNKSPHDYKCINCLKAKLPLNHAVWDKECPSMHMERKKITERNPDNKYKFFPTKEDWKWERKLEVTDNVGSSADASQRKEVSGGRTSDQGRGWRGTPDGGWEGMRARRTPDAGIRGAFNRMPPPTQANKGKERDTSDAEPVSQASNNSLILPSMPSQVRQFIRRTTQEASAGRQSVLGDYWGPETSGIEHPDSEVHHENHADLC